MDNCFVHAWIVEVIGLSIKIHYNTWFILCSYSLTYFKVLPDATSYVRNRANKGILFFCCSVHTLPSGSGMHCGLLAPRRHYKLPPHNNIVVLSEALSLHDPYIPGIKRGRTIVLTHTHFFIFASMTILVHVRTSLYIEGKI
jgi:hypothetical protein